MTNFITLLCSIAFFTSTTLVHAIDSASYRRCIVEQTEASVCLFRNFECNYDCGDGIKLDVAQDSNTCDDIPKLCRKAECCEKCTAELQASINCILEDCGETDCTNNQEAVVTTMDKGLPNFAVRDASDGYSISFFSTTTFIATIMMMMMI
mmetsp:Transcript_23564/g.26823  ORF Transcript_23564/g.26823 Transcript_23564/m.26823 type:complete len:151 (-) Transcript_23564:164-616(-)